MSSLRQYLEGVHEAPLKSQAVREPDGGAAVGCQVDVNHLGEGGGGGGGGNGRWRRRRRI